MPHDEAEADQLAPPHFDGTYHRATIGAAPVRGVRRSNKTCGEQSARKGSRHS